MIPKSCALKTGVFPLLIGFMSFLTACSTPAIHDVVIRNGMIFDGSGNAPFRGDLAIEGDRIVEVGDLRAARGRTELDAEGMAVAPGFINVLSWATESLLADGRSQSNIRQGVTLEIFGEGWSMGPLNPEMKENLSASQGDVRYEVSWRTLGGYLDHLAERGVSPNVASFVGATTVRIHEMGYEDRPPTADELEKMRALVRAAMKEGALGVASALIYAPAFYARTEELAALADAAGELGGCYVSHLRSEGERFLEALEEFLFIAREAKVAGHIYHLKAAGRENWSKMDEAIRRIEAAREAGLQITADMYTYTAAATGLDAAMPPWVQEGGYDAWARRLRDPETRTKVAAEMRAQAPDWENLYFGAGSPDNIILSGFKSERLKMFTGKTLGEVAGWRGTTPEETAMDLVIEDGSRVGAVYFLMDEGNVRKQLALPWVTFGSDAASLAPEGVFLKSNPHPRAYGNFARLLGKYVREEQIIPLEEAVRRLTLFPAETFRLENRGALRPGYFADVVVFDPGTIQDHATFAEPHQYASGMAHVFVNGEAVLREGRHTGAKPGRVIRGAAARKP
jgi:N-acyl-D-amino-acid deacylase